jgi:hypothetical protein
MVRLVLVSVKTNRTTKTLVRNYYVNFMFVNHECMSIISQQDATTYSLFISVVNVVGLELQFQANYVNDRLQ